MKPNDWLLYHGTDALIGESIGIRSNIGVGSNDLTLGNGFYTTTSKELALYYSHIMMRARLLDLGKNPDKALTGEVHQIILSRNFRLLKENDKLDIGASICAMKGAGIAMSNIKMLLPSELASFPATVAFIEEAGFQEMNAKEYLTRALGFDGLAFVQEPYLPWNYEPEKIGIDWKECWSVWFDNPPKTTVIYCPEKIISATIIHNGKQSLLQQSQSSSEMNLEP